MHSVSATDNLTSRHCRTVMISVLVPFFRLPPLHLRRPSPRRLRTRRFSATSPPSPTSTASPCDACWRVIGRARNAIRHTARREGAHFLGGLSDSGVVWVRGEHGRVGRQIAEAISRRVALRNRLSLVLGGCSDCDVYKQVWRRDLSSFHVLQHLLADQGRTAAMRHWPGGGGTGE